MAMLVNFMLHVIYPNKKILIKKKQAKSFLWLVKEEEVGDLQHEKELMCHC